MPPSHLAFRSTVASWHAATTPNGVVHDREEAEPPLILAMVVESQASRRRADSGDASSQPVWPKDPARSGESCLGAQWSEPYHPVGELVSHAHTSTLLGLLTQHPLALPFGSQPAALPAVRVVIDFNQALHATTRNELRVFAELPDGECVRTVPRAPSPSSVDQLWTHLYAAMLFSRKYFSRADSLFSSKYSRTMPMTWPYVPKGSLFGQSLP